MAKHYIQDASQLANTKKNDTIILFGSAVYAQFDSNVKKVSRSNNTNKAGLIEQPERFVNQSLLTLFQKESDILRLFVEANIIQELKAAKQTKIYLAHDGVVKHAKSQTKNDDYIYFVVNKVESEKMYLIELWRFTNGELISVEERNIAIDYHTEIESQLAYEIKRATESEKSSLKVLLTGFHGLGDEAVGNIIQRQYPEVTDAAGHILKQKNKSLKSVNNFFVLDFEKLPLAQNPLSLHEDVKTRSYMVPAFIALSGITIFYGLSFYGQYKLDSAIAAYHESLAKIESIYSKGRAPIQLVQQRQYYLEDLAKHEPATGNNIERVLTAISVARQQVPSFEPLFETISYDTNGAIPLQNSSDTYDFVLEVSFSSDTENGLLEKAKILQTEITKTLGVSTQSTSIPRKAGGQSGRYIVSMAGDFNQ